MGRGRRYFKRGGISLMSAFEKKEKIVGGGVLFYAQKAMEKDEEAKKNAYQKLFEIEKDYNHYKIGHDEAVKKATPLIKIFNDVSEKIAERYKQPITRITMRYFAFGR